MSKLFRFAGKKLAPLLLAIFIIMLIALLISAKYPSILIFIAIPALLLGFWLGNLNNPAVSYRKRKVKKQTRDIVKMNEQFMIQSAALKSAANGIIITDTTGIIEWVNPGFTRLTGYSAEESIGNNLKFLNSGIHDKEFFRHMWTEIMAGRVWQNEIVNRRKDGSLYTEEMTITPVLDDKNTIRSYVAIKQDISERKRLEEVLKKEKKRMEAELDVARDIQMSMLRKNDGQSDQGPDAEIFARLIPAREVGGDFYDYQWLDEENLYFVIGDVSGKGVPAALFMAVAKTLLKTAARQTRSTSETLTLVNQEISRDNENFMFITVFMGILNTTTGYLSYTNAGHNPTYLMKKSDKSLVSLTELHGLVVGAMEDVQYEETVLRIERGDSLFVYTDGVTEARNQDNKLYSDDRLSSFLETQWNSSPHELTKNLLGEVRYHENGAEPADDITMLTIRFKEQSEGALVDYLFTNLTNNLESVHEFASQFDAFAEKHQLNLEIRQQLQIVFDELLSNIVKYAFTDGLVHDIEVKIRVYHDKITVTILDEGIPFNPFDNMPVDTSAQVEDREIGGLGIHLVKFLVDDYQYEYKQQIGKNSTHFTKNLNT